MTEFKPKTTNYILPVSINAPVEEVFPLVSPIEEYRWIPGWKAELIHCPDEKIGQGTIFNEIFSAPFLVGNVKGKTTWTYVVFDPENYDIHFRLDNENSSTLYKIELEDDGKGGTGGKLDMTYTATTKKGNKLVENGMKEKIQIMLTILKTMLKYYSENKELIPSSKLQKVVPMEKLSIADKIRIVLNRTARKKMEDKVRERYLKMWSIEN
jgi:hypothetical protein